LLNTGLKAANQKTSKPAGRVPPDAFLFVQAATKRKQKVPATAWGSRVSVRETPTTVKTYPAYGRFFATLFYCERSMLTPLAHIFCHLGAHVLLGFKTQLHKG
jgi:hypothetical protein